MATITEADILKALSSVQDPDLHRDIVSLGFVKDVKVSGGKATFTVELTTPACPVKDLLKDQCEAAVRALGISDVQVNMTARVRETTDAELLPDVRNVIAIASGKGGVGKSTVAVNLAVALSREGASVGLLDADVYGPSIPMMMGCASERPWTENGKIIPIERFGLKLMSLGFLLEEGQAVLWRGPMVAGTVKQLLADVNWGGMDYLLVDLPPGTGDAPMSLAQLVPLTGVVIVTTPQEVAANIAAKSVALFRRLNSTIVGVIENMAGFICPNCAHETQVFSGTTGAALAAQIKVPLLGSVPLDPEISSSGDDGTPSIIRHPASAQARRFAEIAGALARQISIQSYAEKDLVRGLK